jgi:SAM-dependent methyltransferase
MRQRNRVEQQFADFWDLFVEDFDQDLPVYLDLAAKYASPILEIGCSTGRVIERLAREGHEVHGIDTHRSMLEIAHRRLRPWRDRARVFDLDLRHRSPSERYHAVFATLYVFNNLIDIEEQRLFLRNAMRAMRSPAILVLDLFCPLALVRPELAGEARPIERTCRGHDLRVLDRRDMLTPLLERRTQSFQIDGGPLCEMVTHRRYLTPQQAARLLEEAAFENVRWIQGYDLSTARVVEVADQPAGPFLILGEI